MSEKRTVYLTPETLALVRPGEILSGRLNDVCQRYAALLELAPYVQICADDSRAEAQADLAAFRRALQPD